MDQLLLSKLKESKTIIDETAELLRKRDKYDTTPFGIGVIVFIILVYLINSILSLVLHWPNGLLPFLLKGIISIILTIPLIKVVSNKFIPMTIKSFRKGKINAIQNKINNNHDRLEKIDVLPENYWTPYRANKIIEFIVNKRADNLKEALNLLESDVKHKELIEEMRSLPY